ncbi:MAG: shikimate dehydrogenase [Lentimicrobiaceae bacterium]|nr:shikimate dehydrogenase [Lentimicrobiaceae bacterium]
MRQYALIGSKLNHSFSPSVFAEIFKTENVSDAEYFLLEVSDINDLLYKIETTPELLGFNVTIPYKTSILPYLSDIDDEAKAIGAVNCVKISRNGKVKLTGYNTDHLGFQDSIIEILENRSLSNALIIGTGGASKAVKYVFDKWNINSVFVSREAKGSNIVNYDMIDESLVNKTEIIVNATPVGMYPQDNQLVNFPYNLVSRHHIFVDLIYNPAETLFLKETKSKGCTCINGMKMLIKQAEYSWQIWKVE